MSLVSWRQTVTVTVIVTVTVCFVLSLLVFVKINLPQSLLAAPLVKFRAKANCGSKKAMTWQDDERQVFASFMFVLLKRSVKIKRLS